MIQRQAKHHGARLIFDVGHATAVRNTMGEGAMSRVVK
jgi:hypothetical protein